MRTERIAALLLVLAATLALVGCGYALVGHGVTVDPTIKRIGVPVFKDRTNKPGLDVKITQEVIQELLKRGHFDVVPDTTGVDALVEGELLSYVVQAVGFNAGTGFGATPAPGSAEVSRYTITVTAKVKYSKVGVAEPIWANDGFLIRDEYDLGTDPASLFDRENQAVDRLSTAFAGSLVSAMLEAF
jgi:hypothetical protein